MPETSQAFRATGRYAGMSLEEILQQPNGREYLRFVSRGTMPSPGMDEIRRFLAENPERKGAVSWLDVPGGAQTSTRAVAEAVVEQPQRRYPLPNRLRYLVLKRDDFRCRLCGARATTMNDVQLEVDHIQSVADGGDNSTTNLWTLCRRCNAGKGGESLKLV